MEGVPSDGVVCASRPLGAALQGRDMSVRPYRRRWAWAHRVGIDRGVGCTAAVKEPVMDVDGLELLTEKECRGLLCQARVGRVAVSRGEVPAVFPVNYMVAGEEILFFTAE